MAIEIKFKCDHSDSTITVGISEKRKEVEIRTKEFVGKNVHLICLNKYEAAKLAKEIRKQISFLQD